jgi:hypothetical protein
VALGAAGVVALGWDGYALLVALLVGQRWGAGAVLTVLGVTVAGLGGLFLAWLVWPHRARLRWPARWRHRYDPQVQSSSPHPLPPNSSRPKFSE